MSKHQPKYWIVGLIAILGSTTLSAQAYDVLLPMGDIIGEPTLWPTTLLGTHTFEGDTAYCIVRGKVYDDPIDSDFDRWGSKIMRVDDIEGTPVATELVSTVGWRAFANPDPFGTILPGNRIGVVGDYLQFLDVATDAVYRMHKSTGALSVFVSTTGVKNVTTVGFGGLIDATAFDANGAMAFYEQTSDSILLAEVNSNGNLTTDAQVSIFVPRQDIVDLYNGVAPVNLVAGGMTFACNGDLYWTLSQTGSTGDPGGSIYKRSAADGTLSRVLEQLDIQLVTFAFGNVGFNDIFAAPDGNIYFYDRASDSILYFDPEDPVNSLAIYLTEAELVGGPAGNDFVGSFEAYGTQLAWNHSLSGDSRDIYAYPLAEIPGDYDGDGDVDSDDYATFQDCLSGPAASPTPSGLGVTVADCLDVFDRDCDADVDLKDFAYFQTVFGQ